MARDNNSTKNKAIDDDIAKNTTQQENLPLNTPTIPTTVIIWDIQIG